MASPRTRAVAGNQADQRLVPGLSLPEARPSTNLLRTLVGGEDASEGLRRYGTLAARILMSQIFLISGVMKILDWSGTEAQMDQHGMFWIPFFHVAAMLTELGAGLSLLLGYKARLGALLLFLFLIPVTITFHHFWADPPDQ